MKEKTYRLFLFCVVCFILSSFGCSDRQSGTPDSAAEARPPVASADETQIKVLIIDGINNHDWQKTTAATKATLEKTGRFDVDVSTSPPKGSSKDEWEAWRPTFTDYEVVVSNFNDGCAEADGCETPWSSETQADFESFVGQGGGFVSVHAADNAFVDWPEYNAMIGVGGWGGRMAGKSGSLLRLANGAWKPTSPDEGASGTHGEIRDYLVIHDQPSHPILSGLPAEWMHAADELYAALRGPAKNVEVLAHSSSLVTHEAEPMMMVITYGQGKIFHLPMGHSTDEGTALHCVGFQTVLARGTEYVATGKVTLGIPSSFPGRDEPVVIAPNELDW